MPDPGMWLQQKAAERLGHDRPYHGLQRDFRNFLIEEMNYDISPSTLSGLFIHGFNPSMFRTDITKQWAEFLNCTRYEMAVAHDIIEAEIPEIELRDEAAQVVNLVGKLSIHGDVDKLRRILAVVQAVDSVD